MSEYDENQPVSGSEQGEGQEQSPDPMQNLKAEFSRKFQNTSSALEELKAQNQALSQTISQLNERLAPKQQVEEPSEDFLDLNPREYKAKIEQEIMEKVQRSQAEQQQQQQRLQSTIYDLQQEYPELKKPGSELSKAAVEAHDALPGNLQNTAEGYKLAVSEAARKHRIAPGYASQGSTTEDFSFGGQSKGKQSRDRKSEEVPDAAMQFASLLYGNKFDAKTYKEKLKPYVEKHRSKGNRVPWDNKGGR